jgi:hypothetical protein
MQAIITVTGFDPQVGSFTSSTPYNLGSQQYRQRQRAILHLFLHPRESEAISEEVCPDELIYAQETILDHILNGQLLKAWNYFLDFMKPQSCLQKNPFGHFTESISEPPSPSEDPWEDDKDYPSEAWRDEVRHGDTRSGYKDWVSHQKDEVQS